MHGFNAQGSLLPPPLSPPDASASAASPANARSRERVPAAGRRRRAVALRLVPALAAAAYLTFTPAAAARRNRTKEHKEEILQLFLKLEEGLFGTRQLDAAEDLIDDRDTAAQDRAWLQAAVAQYHRTMELDAAAGLRYLAPLVLGKDHARAWQKRLRTAERQRRTRWHKQKMAALRQHKDPPPAPDGLAVSFPAPDKWTINAANVPLALEVARCLMALGQVQPALRVIDAQGRAFEDDGRVLAFECLGDLYVRMRHFNKAITSFKDARGLLHALKYDTQSFTAWQKVTDRRLQRKLADARRRHEIDKYGLGWVQYRDAEHHRIKRRRYVDAAYRYAQIMQDHPDSVYAEAARCYRVKCLLKLATWGRDHAAAACIRELRQTIKQQQAFVRFARRCGVPDARLDQANAAVEANEQKLEAYEAIPTGDDALEAAVAAVRAAGKRKRWGLYRGEMILDLGNHRLEVALDQDAAAPYFEAAALWFDGVQKVDHTVTTYTVPGKARDVSQPPQHERRRDKWNNIRRNKPKVGDLFNRRTTPWYWRHMRKRVALHAGLLAFIDRDFDTARKEWTTLLKVDDFYAKCEKIGRGSTYNRLMWNLDHHDGCLYAHPDEMKTVSRSRRLPVFLADLAYESEDRRKALRLYNDLLAGKHGRLRRGERAYILYAKGACLSWLGKPGEDVAFYKKHYREVRGTPSEARYLLALANRMRAAADRESWAQSLAYYRRLLQTEPRSPQALDGAYFCALACLRAGRLDDAEDLLARYVRKCRSGGYSARARSVLDQLDKNK